VNFKKKQFKGVGSVKGVIFSEKAETCSEILAMTKCHEIFPSCRIVVQNAVLTHSRKTPTSQNTNNSNYVPTQKDQQGKREKGMHVLSVFTSWFHSQQDHAEKKQLGEGKKPINTA